MEFDHFLSRVIFKHITDNSDVGVFLSFHCFRLCWTVRPMTGGSRWRELRCKLKILFLN